MSQERADLLSVWKRLYYLAKHDDEPDSKAANKAVAAVRTVVEDDKDVKIVNPEFKDVTEEVIICNSDTPEVNSPAQRDEGEEAKIIVGITRSAADRRTNNYTKALPQHPGATPAALLTDDKGMQNEAKVAGLVVLASEAFKRILKTLSDASTASEFDTTRSIDSVH